MTGMPFQVANWPRRRLIGAVEQGFGFADAPEITLESNPEDMHRFVEVSAPEWRERYGIEAASETTPERAAGTAADKAIVDHLVGLVEEKAREIEAERSQANTRKAIRFVLDHPVKEVELWGMRAYRMMIDDRIALREVEELGAGRFLPDGLRSTLGVAADAWFFAVGTLVSLAVLFAFHPLAFPAMLALAAAGGVSGALAELFSTSLDDNFTIPVAVAAAVGLVARLVVAGSF